MSRLGPIQICVCICTFKRPSLLAELLTSLEHQRTEKQFNYSIVVVDNDVHRSAEPVVAHWRSQSGIAIAYHHEPCRNIALARNKAVTAATGDFLAFIDDDEVACADWLFNLFMTARRHGADAILGPVLPRYETTPPKWVVKGAFFERPRYPTGTALPWNHTRTGNVLLSNRVFERAGGLFNADFRHSEDQEFFKRAIANNCVVVWCDEAVAFETERAERFKMSYFLKRGLLRGNVSLRLQDRKLLTIGKSIAALALYTCIVPALALVRPDLAIKYLMKNCDHLGKLLAACNVNVQPYLT